MHTFAVSQIGASHIVKARPCQDYSASCQTDDYALAVVADGHGGEAYFRSDRGARMAVESAVGVLTEFISHTHNMNELPEGNWQRQVASALIAEWQQRIAADYQQDPFAEATDRWQKAYGTTLIVALCTQQHFFGMQIGDGRCVAIGNRDTVEHPIPWDKRCFLNRTTSLCDRDALNEFRFCFRNIKSLRAVFVSTDGAEDCFADLNGLYDFYRILNNQLSADFDAAVEALRAYLPQMTQKGSTDDISISGIQIG